ncbi:mannose-6-phosphate isomerase, class I [Plantibacter sp. Leaf314]|uniref:mannose-6-phosphate isomerase, class I n=1 Tax=Plantibacter sp. Leaf314 TaxID=1736333 RepID=UPI0006FCC994|nr:mannose-6-phosphate isomerase, class I [Plantibacter sp. Leaf314]KQQ50551.1 hypothetical protein ASF68_15950 [Plantibacter sp. Leaf314]
MGLHRITSDPKRYAWGSTTAIPEMLGVPADGSPQAELWLGAHPGSVTELVGQDRGLPSSLNEWIASDPDAALGGRSRMPFLLKLLAAARPLSLQVHPTPDRARAGFADEDSRGVPLDAPHRNYKDAWHKPEIIVALQDGFRALCGFRAVEESCELLTYLASLVDVPGRVVLEALLAQLVDEGLESTVRSVLERPTPGAVAALVGAAGAGTVGEGLGDDDGPARWSAERELILQLAEAYPGDPGIVVAALLNLVTLQEGEALFLPAGNIHAYLSGFGVEVMASSDNVLRGGLTPKHVDVPELLAVLDFEPLPIPFVEPIARTGGGVVYPVPVDDFLLARIGPGTATGLAGGEAAVIVVTAGTARVEQGSETMVLERGTAVFVSPGPDPVTVSTDGRVFVATG